MPRLRSVALIVLAILLVAAPWLAAGNVALLNLAFFTFLFISQGVAWNILGGFAGYVSFGYAAFFGLGAYTTALLWLAGWPPVLTYPLAGGVAGAFSLLVGLPTLRLVGPYFSIATIGVGEAMRVLMLNLDKITGGASGLNLPTVVPPKTWFYFAALTLAVISFGVAVWIRNSRLGFGLRALRLDQEAAESLGVRTALFKNVAHVLSATLVGACGGLYATYLQYVHPDTVFSFTQSISLVLIALIGGLGSLWGPVLGAVIFYAVQDYLLTSYPTFHLLVYGVLLLFIMLFEPKGLAGVASRLWSRWHPAATAVSDQPPSSSAEGDRTPVPRARAERAGTERFR